jgi:DNA-binding transcriptional regulator YbjK
MVHSAAELQCALNTMQATPGFLTRPGGVAIVVHASVPSSSLSAAVQTLLDTAPVSKIVQRYELETTDPKTLSLVQRAMRQCGNGALDRFVRELKARHQDVLFDLGVDHSFAYM